MPTISDIKAGGAYVEIGTKDSALIAGLNRAATKLRQFGSAVRGIGLEIGAVGAGMFAPLFAASKAFADEGEKLALLSKKTGVSAEELSTLGYAARRSGVDIDALGSAITKMGKTFTAASEGSKEANDALASLGLTVSQLNGLSPDQRFKAIAEALSDISDPSIRAGKAMEIFGKSGAELLPLLDQGAKGIQEMEDHAKSLGLEWTTKEVKAAKQFSESLKDLWDVSGRLAARIGGAVAPVMKAAAQFLTGGAMAAGEWVEKHKEVFEIAAAVGGSLVLLGGAVVILGTVISNVGVLLGTFASAMGLVVTVIGAVFSPIGIAVAAAAGLGYAFFKLTDTGKQMAKDLGKLWNTISSDAMAAFDGIKDAMAAGDFGTAAKILWTVIRLEFSKGMSGLWDPLVKGFYITKSAISDGWSNTVDDLKTTWSLAKEYLSSWDGIKAAASKFFEWIVNAWQASVDFLASKFAKVKVDLDFADTEKQIRETGKTNIAAGKVTQADVDKQVEQARADADDQLNKQNNLQDANRKADYDAKQKAIDDKFKAAQPTAVADGEAERNRIELAAAQRKLENAKQLAAALASIDPERQAEIDRLQKELTDLIAQAKGEAAKGSKDKDDGDDKKKDKPKIPTPDQVFAAVGAFQIQNQAMANEVFGKSFDYSMAEQTAKNTAKTAELLAKLVGKSGFKPFRGIPST